MILALRTDKPEAELYLYKNADLLATYTWEAHRELSDTILNKIEQLLKKESVNSEALKGIVVYRGPGSFTGLRIGITVANTLAYAQKIPIVGTEGENWATEGVRQLEGGVAGELIVLPEYGAQPNITKPRK